MLNFLKKKPSKKELKTASANPENPYANSDNAGPSAKNAQNIDSSQRNRGSVQVSMEASNRSTDNGATSEI